MLNPCETGQCDIITIHRLLNIWRRSLEVMFAGTEHDWTAVAAKTLVSVNIPVFWSHVHVILHCGVRHPKCLIMT